MTVVNSMTVANFLSSGTWLVVRNVLVFVGAIFWLSLTYWVYKDARRRIEDPLLVGMATLLGLVPFVGPLIYMLFRPPEYLEDVHERELEIRAMEERLRTQDLRCPVCRAEVDPAFLICPVCTTKLKQACVSCKAPLEPLWQICPYCETPVVRRPPVELAGEGAIVPPAETPITAPRRTGRRRRRSAE